MEQCQRCGEEGEDRRTLWMACFYEMSELGLPFEQRTLFDAEKEKLTPCTPPVDLPVEGFRSIRIQAGTVTTSGELYPLNFYTMRVCKQCRGDWMMAIKRWFTEQGRAIGAGVN